MTQNWIKSGEIADYRDAVQKQLAGELDKSRFQAIRLQQGVYGQRQEGVNMVRIKLPGGVVRADQLEAIADVLDDFSELEIASVTTRQDIQLHSIALEKTPDALEKLAKADLTSREACGNTVRNITACPLAGVCPSEHCNVQPIVEKVAQRFLRHPLTQHLPRKFKMSFSGCEADCAQGLFHDLAVIATKRDGKFGFKILAAGGLGHKPRQAIVLEEFVEEAGLLSVVEAVLALHHRYSDRKRRARARLKFLLEKLGEETFVKKYRLELRRTQQVYGGKAFMAVKWLNADERMKPLLSAVGSPRDIIHQRQRDLLLYPVLLPLGDLTAEQMRGLAKVVKKHSVKNSDKEIELRVTQDQNVMLLNIQEANLQAIDHDVARLGLTMPVTGSDVVACPGTWTCRLGITASRLVSDALVGSTGDLRIRVSGCHNGCAQPYVADIGLHGEGRRINGKLIPHYRMHFGGDGRSDGSIAVRGPEVPARLVPAAINHVKQEYERTHLENERFRDWVHRQQEGYFNHLLEDLSVLHSPESEWLEKDFGETEDFRVLALGGGECMGAKLDVVSANFSEAAHEREYRRVFQLAKKETDALDCVEAILRLVAKALLFTDGKEQSPEGLEELAKLIDEKMNVPSHLAESFIVFVEEIQILRSAFNDDRFEKLAKAQDLWTVLMAKECESSDMRLNVGASLPQVAQLVALPKKGEHVSSESHL